MEKQGLQYRLKSLKLLKRAAAIFLIAIAVVFSLAACGGSRSGETEENQGDGGSRLEANQVKFGEVIISLDDEAGPLVEELGEAQQYYEYPSCLYEGSDKTWDYGDIAILTYPDGEKDYVSSINVLGEGAEISSGIRVGDSVKALQEFYGDRVKKESSTIYRVEESGFGIDYMVKDDRISEIDIYLNQ